MSLQSKIQGWREIQAFDNRLWLTLTKIFFPGEHLLPYRFKGLDILTDRSGGDANGAREILTSPMYRRIIPKMKFNAPVNVLDIGANNGGFPLLLTTSGVELRKILSVEFNPQTFVRLNFNLTRNLDCDVLPLNAALCGTDCIIDCSLGKGSVSDSIYADSGGKDKKSFRISGFTLDTLIDTHFRDEVIDICKIDVEGAEFDVFLQPFHQNLKWCRYLIIEIHERDGRKAEDIVPIIANCGFVRQESEADADPTVHFFINSELE
jgi:FkbM family methyltransferase